MIEIQGLTKIYGGVRAVNDVSFSVGTGEIFGFVGPNGAGKSTTLKILATLLAPTSGRAMVDGLDVTTNVFEVRGRIGYMPDFFGVYDRLTSAEYLAFYAACYHVPRRRRAAITADLLELVNLTEKRDAQVNSLSRGMKQRLCLARALVHDPLVLLLDEPASGLDPRARVEMRELLKELRSMGKTIIISSHILPELSELCTSAAILDRGRVLAAGPLETLVAPGAGSRVRVDVDGDPEVALRAAPGVEGVTSLFPLDEGGMELAYNPDVTDPGRLLQALLTAGVRVRSYTPVAADLEDVFMRVTQAPPS
ncbi:MAG: type transport system ATP-binding protein [Chloroflexota bacterium]|jgi:ABC-2 type transport system ATP-binding protein|nr:type transport system ATP-binding protein [Chloroflexota bacterium]